MCHLPPGPQWGVGWSCGLATPTYIRWPPPGGVRKALADGNHVTWAISGHLFLAFQEPSWFWPGHCGGVPCSRTMAVTM